MYKILVNNDDGIQAEGIKALVKALSHIAEVYVVAPMEQQSGKGQSLTFREPVRVEEVEMEGATKAYALSGCPTDCAKWGISILGDEIKFDYLFSGINMGANLGTASFYSGTCGAALEGAMNGIHSIALSVDTHEANQFEYICSMIPELIEMSNTLPASTVISVNSPNLPAWKIKGVKITSPATHLYGDCYYFQHEGDDKYQMVCIHSEADYSLDNDYNWLKQDYVAVTALSTALEDGASLRRLHSYSIAKSLCVFIGAQEGNAACINKAKRWNKKIVKWAKCVNRLDIPVINACQIGKGDEVKGIIDNINHAEKVELADFNAWASKDFEALATLAMEKKVFLAGLETHINIVQTAGQFLKEGFDVTIIEDCCSSRDKHDHEVAIKNLRKAGCRITTAEAAVMEILGSQKHNAYKSIEEIIKK